MVNTTFLAQISALMIDSILNIVFVVTRNKGGWIIYFCLFLSILSIALLLIKIENLKGFKETHRSVIRLIIVIIYTEASFYQPSILILLGHFQHIILDDKISKLSGFLYLAIRTSIYQSEDTLFIVLKYIILTVPSIKTKLAGKDKEGDEVNLPLSILGVISSEQFAIYKNSSQNCVFSNLGDDQLIFQSIGVDQYGGVINSNTQRQLGQYPFLVQLQGDQQTSQNQPQDILEIRRVQSRSLHYEKINQILEKFFNTNKSIRHQSLNLFEDRQMDITKIEIDNDVYVVINLMNNLPKQKVVDLDWRENVLRILHKVAHDMRTPLNAIINMQSCLKEYLDPFYQQRYLKPSLNSCKLLMHLLEDILDAAQIGQNKLRIVNKQFNFEKLIRKTIQLFEVQAASKKIQINVQNNLDRKSITSDKQRLRQIIMNLLSNAIKYTSSQGQVYIRVSQLEDNLVEIQVEDTGLGIKSQDLELLFKDFNRITNKEDEALNQRGVGLGLQISKDLAILMGSPYGVKVESTYGVGTTFTFCIYDFNEDDSYSVQDAEEQGPASQIQNLNPIDTHSFPNDNYDDGLINSNKVESVEAQEMMKLSPSVQIKVPRIAVKTPVKVASGERSKLKAQLSGMENSQPIRNQYANSRYFTASFQEIQLDSAQSLKLSQRVLEKQSSTNKTQQMDVILKKLVSHWKEIFNGKPEILVVDDNEYNIMALSFLLESFGIFTDSAISGVEAIKLVTKRQNENQQYRCVFLDIEMDGMDGFQTNHHLKSISSSLIVFACSGWTDEKIKEDCLKAGMQDVISKPVQKQGIKRLFKRHFQYLRVNSSQLQMPS